MQGAALAKCRIFEGDDASDLRDLCNFFYRINNWLGLSDEAGARGLMERAHLAR